MIANLHYLSLNNAIFFYRFGQRLYLYQVASQRQYTYGQQCLLHADTMIRTTLVRLS